jgi:mannitol/fructose-specific phosphotransferase system IIA component (Ntr-type)
VNFSDLLGEAQILSGFEARDKEEAFGKILESLEASGALPSGMRPAVHQALVARENVSSTGMEHGVALPHARVDGLGRAAVALAISPSGVPFRASDGRPARLIALMAFPREEIQEANRTLAAVARILSAEETRQALIAAGSPAEARRLILERERPKKKAGR